MTIGTYVCDKDDLNAEYPAIIVYDHSIVNNPGLFSIKRTNGYLSLREESELREIEPIEFCKVWCKKQIKY